MAGTVVLLCAGLSTGAAAVLGVSGGPSETGRLTVAEIGTAAEGAGFRGPSLAMAIAVALAESGGDPGATDHDTNGTVDRGLWQINSVHRTYSAACDYDPACAASAAYAISGGGTNWSAWVTFEHGEEIAYLPAAVDWVNTQVGVP